MRQMSTSHDLPHKDMVFEPVDYIEFLYILTYIYFLQYVK